MPDGSSSAAPVTNPGPSNRRTIHRSFLVLVLLDFWASGGVVSAMKIFGARDRMSKEAFAVFRRQSSRFRFARSEFVLLRNAKPNAVIRYRFQRWFPNLTSYWGSFEGIPKRCHCVEQGDQAIHSSLNLSLIHISEPTRRTPISYAVFCLKKKNT